MKLPKAIEIGELNIKEAGRKMPPDTLDALKLLVEAGKDKVQSRGSLRPGFYVLP
ncbi:unnamed protein product, partial [marine sediment metagenome]